MQVVVQADELADIAGLTRSLAKGAVAEVPIVFVANASAGTCDVLVDNGEAGVGYTLLAEVVEPGRVSVAHGAIDRLARHVGKCALTLQCVDQTLVVRGGSLEATLPVIALGEEGEVALTWLAATGQLAHEGAISAGALKRALEFVAHAVSKDQYARPVLNCVALRHDVATQRLVVVAADGYRLARHQIAHAQALIHEEREWLVPAKHAAILTGILQLVEPTQSVLLETGIGESLALTAVVGPARWRSALVDGKFPEVEPIISTALDAPCRLMVNRAELQTATALANAFSAGKGVELVQRAETLTVRSHASELGQTQQTLAAKVTQQGEPSERVLLMDARYLQDACAAIPDADVTIGTTSPSSAIFIHGATLDAVCVIMPMIPSS